MALLLNFVIYYCFQETIDFENETSNYITTPSVYTGDSQRVCSENGCDRKFFYRYKVGSNDFLITSKGKNSFNPAPGSVKLVKYDRDNPTIAFFTKMNVLYLFYLIRL